MRVFLRLEFAKPASIGCYLCSLLEAIDELGSVSAATKAIHSNRRDTQKLAKSMNRRLGQMVAMKPGRHGGAHLTPEGIQLVKLFRKIEYGIHQVFAEDLRYLEKIVDEDSHAPRWLSRWERWRQSQHVTIEKPKPLKDLNKLAAETRITSTWVYLGLQTNKLWFAAEHLALLQAIMKFGSIAAAADSMGWTYYHARREVNLLNGCLGGAVITARGRGGGAYVTPKAQNFVKRFCKIQQDVYRLFAEELRQAARIVGDDPKAVQIIPRYAQLREPKRARRDDSKAAGQARKPDTGTKTAVPGISSRKRNASACTKAGR